MFTSKLNSITHDLSDELVSKLSQDFTTYIKHYVKQRSLLIKQNITYKQTLHSSLSLSTKKITIRLIPRLHPSSLIVLSKQTVIPQSFFCFPIIDSIMRSNSFTLNFIDHFDTYNSFLKAKNAMERIPTLFTQYPSHDVMLKINNDSFWLWFFITTITQFTSLYNINFTNDNNDNIYTLCLFISNLLTKKVTAFYSLLSKYISNIKHAIKLKHNRTQLSRFSTYRKAYCQICKRFYCNVHFYDKASVDVYNNMKVVSHFQMKTSENRNAIIKNISPYLQDKGEMYLNEYACDYDNRNDCCKVNKITVTASSHEDELIRQMNMNDFYLLNVLLTTTLFDNACFICMLFNYKYKCNYIDALLSFITLDRKRMKIDKYFITAYPPLQSLLPEKLTVIFNDNRTTTLNNAYTSNNTNNTHNNEYYNDLYNQKNFEPCSHAGLCKKDICKCFIRGHCEEYCLCYKNCELKFQGCNCIGNCRFNGENSINSTCPCIQKGRECQIGKCKSCISCSNMSIQLRKYKKVILGQSLIIPSNGLFAYENIKANDLIGVYLGEIVERTELDRRSVFSDELEKHYSFSQDDNFDIDALRCGNAMRYINHSKYGYENCFAKNVFTQGRIIVALYAKRDIMKGEELYFDYRMKSVHWINMYNKQYKP